MAQVTQDVRRDCDPEHGYRGVQSRVSWSSVLARCGSHRERYGTGRRPPQPIACLAAAQWVASCPALCGEFLRAQIPTLDASEHKITIVCTPPRRLLHDPQRWQERMGSFMLKAAASCASGACTGSGPHCLHGSVYIKDLHVGCTACGTIPCPCCCQPSLKVRLDVALPRVYTAKSQQDKARQTLGACCHLLNVNRLWQRPSCPSSAIQLTRRRTYALHSIATASMFTFEQLCLCSPRTLIARFLRYARLRVDLPGATTPSLQRKSVFRGRPDADAAHCSRQLCPHSVHW